MRCKEFYEIYHPITATPFACNESYIEYSPCEALKPYIKCFWGSRRPYRQKKTDIPTRGIVTPDTCVDIIFTVNFTKNQIESGFCGIDDRSFATYSKNEEERLVSTFAIRFYSWTAFLFSEDSMKGTKNAFLDGDCHFSKLKRAIEPFLFDMVTIEERIQVAQKYLLEHMYTERSNSIIQDALAEMLLRKGTIEIVQLSQEIHISSRQIERLFQEYIGISPKRLASLIRYQYLWNDILYRPHFQVLDAVFRYGYTDQAHLLHEFKGFHTMTISQAKRYALDHVGFLQEES